MCFNRVLGHYELPEQFQCALAQTLQVDLNHGRKMHPHTITYTLYPSFTYLFYFGSYQYAYRQ
jgi:hypothetical protein